MARTVREKAVDRLLMLYLLDDVFSRKGLHFLPETKLQKLVFLSERSMVGERKKGFNFYFIKLIHGPFSQELEGDARKLVQVGLLHDRGLEPTECAKAILEDFRDVIEKNGSFTQHVKAANDEFAEVPLDQLLDMIYSIPWGRDKTIADLPQRTPMLYPMKPQNVASEFNMTDEEAEDLLMNFDPKAVGNLVQAMREMKAGQLRTHEQVFCTLRG